MQRVHQLADDVVEPRAQAAAGDDARAHLAGLEMRRRPRSGPDVRFAAAFVGQPMLAHNVAQDVVFLAQHLVVRLLDVVLRACAGELAAEAVDVVDVDLVDPVPTQQTRPTALLARQVHRVFGCGLGCRQRGRRRGGGWGRTGTWRRRRRRRMRLRRGGRRRSRRPEPRQANDGRGDRREERHGELLVGDHRDDVLHVNDVQAMSHTGPQPRWIRVMEVQKINRDEPKSLCSSPTSKSFFVRAFFLQQLCTPAPLLCSQGRRRQAISGGAACRADW